MLNVILGDQSRSSRAMLTSFVTCAVLLIARAFEPSGTVSIQSATNRHLGVRHCSYQLFATDTQGGIGPSTDFDFNIVPALNHEAGFVSFQALNHPAYYITIISSSSIEDGRLGLHNSSNLNVDDASFQLVSGPHPDSYSVQSASKGKFSGAYMSLDNQLRGACAGHYKSPESDIVVTTNPVSIDARTWYFTAPPPPPPPPSQNHTLLVRADQVMHTVDKMYMGCHSDTGYVHQARGFYSQMIIGEVFEFGLWPNQVVSPQAQATIALDESVLFQNFSSLHVSMTGSGSAGLANRGLGNEGLVFHGGREYEGHFFARSKQDAQLVVRLEDYVQGTVLGEVTFFLSAGDWTALNFTIVPNASTNCEGINASLFPEINCKGSNSAAHPCIRCGGQVTVALASAGEVWINYVFVQPGEWGRFAGLPVLQDTVTFLKDMGVTTIRQGGSFAKGDYYFWKNWRGPPHLRTSLGAIWRDCLISGWGPFEMIDLCNAAGFEPIITTSSDELPADLGDLVEYCYGNYSTKWGRQRFDDGHPEPFRVKYFEIGNEEYPPFWVEQVAAMEQRASLLGLPPMFTYMFPDNSGPNKTDAARAEALGLGDRLVTDLHVGSGGAIPKSQALYDAMPFYHQGAVNCETNAGTHNLKRALTEAADLNQFLNVYQPRMKARTASFCTERSGHFDAYDQGLIFFLPNMTWAQPPFYTHKMISDTWQSQAVNVTVFPVMDTTIASAALSDDGKSLVVRYVNSGGPDTVHINIVGLKVAPQAKVWQLQSSDLNADNTPADPFNVVPAEFSLTVDGSPLLLPAQSFTVILYTAL